MTRDFFSSLVPSLRRGKHTTKIPDLTPYILTKGPPKKKRRPQHYHKHIHPQSHSLPQIAIHTCINQKQNTTATEFHILSTHENINMPNTAHFKFIKTFLNTLKFKLPLLMSNLTYHSWRIGIFVKAVCILRNHEA